MPEIRNEIPSDDELLEYFEQSAREHGLDLLVAEDVALFDSRGPIFGPAAAVVRSIVGHEPYRRAYESVFANLHRLNGLPRTHPFWKGSNLRPTYYKLPEFCSMMLAEDPSDETALWFLGTHEAAAGDRFGQAYWLRLHRLGGFPLSWAVRPAYWASGGSVDSDYQFAEFFAEAAPDGDIVDFLKPYSDSGNAHVAAWAMDVAAAWWESFR